MQQESVGGVFEYSIMTSAFFCIILFDKSQSFVGMSWEIVWRPKVTLDCGTYLESISVRTILFGVAQSSIYNFSKWIVSFYRSVKTYNPF
jgi:hypothetical protein